jgi:hypothetical protein
MTSRTGNGHAGAELMQLAGILGGRGGGGADGGQVWRGRCRCGWSSIFAEAHVADVMVRLDGPILADQPGEVLRGGISSGQAG